MQLLGCVKEIRELELIIALPNGCEGFVKISDISRAYTALLESLASGEPTEV